MKEKLFSLTRNDFQWSYYRAKGKGGQKRNKTDSACRCQHLSSKAIACAEESRSQHQNRKKAFERCIKTKEFQDWLRIEIARKNGTLAQIEDEVDRAMNEKYLKIEEIQ